MEKKTYQWVDVFKLLCALLIVYTHCFCYDLGRVGLWVRDIISSIGVPFFFIASGFFFTKGLSGAKNPKEYLKRYWKRMIVMYVLWTLFTLPIESVNVQTFHPEFKIFERIAYIIRAFLFSGWLGIYWYMLALIWGIPVLYFILFQKKRLPYYVTFLTLFVIGILYNSALIENTILAKIIHSLWGSERNIWNVGMFYLCTGSLVAQHEKELSNSCMLWISLAMMSVFADSLIHRNSNIYFMHALSAFFVFNLARTIQIRLPNAFSFLSRRLSTAIYLLHFPFILCFDLYLKKGTMLDFPVAILFSVSVFAVVNLMLPKRMVKTIFGN